MTTLTLRGLTWDHPRAIDPLVAASDYWRSADIDLQWDIRSLRAFGEQPPDEVGQDYDLLLIDHPHVARAVWASSLIPLDTLCSAETLKELATQSAGPSHQSYSYDGRQWALAIDAAVQVAAYRPDLLDAVPRTWPEVHELASSGRMLWPSMGMATFLTLAAALGSPIDLVGDTLISTDQGERVLDLLHGLADAVPAWCIGATPIQVLDHMSTHDDYVYAPLLFGYINYGQHSFRRRSLRFADIPRIADPSLRGSCLGGAGVAVSRHSRHPKAAARVAAWLAGAECQTGMYVRSGGQPGNALAWQSREADAESSSFFSGTIRTLEGAYVRPQHPQWPALQAQCAADISGALSREITDRHAIDRMNRTFRRLILDRPDSDRAGS